jgi:hypothetical protein
MNVSSRALVELLLLGPASDRRQLQDSPVLGDVWIAFAAKPNEPMDLLITPYKERPAGKVAGLLARRIKELNLRPLKSHDANVAYLQGLVAARLYFEELLRVVVPLTMWWRDQKVSSVIDRYGHGSEMTAKIEAIVEWAKARNSDKQAEIAERFAEFNALDRFVALAAVILWAGQQPPEKDTTGALGDALARVERPEPILQTLRKLFTDLLTDVAPKEPQIFQVSLNRKAMPALERSVPAVKGDAARTLFNVRCDNIRWAIFDSGIDATHDALKDHHQKSRVIKTFDFSNIRKIVSLDNLESGTPEFKQRLADLRSGREDDLSESQATEYLTELAKDAENDRPIHWELVEKFIEVKKPSKPLSGHGTHVAGIIGARRPTSTRAIAGEAVGQETTDPGQGTLDGMCPDIKFYDFRVLSKSLQDTEFAIIAALQFLRYLNERNTYISIHGANLSLSIPHDVRNFACGRTPICNECERLVESGVVVVAAAGNLGYQRFETQEGSYEGYTAFSITDPGNADGVITVGATHRYRPHTYGVSFFSSRGPTGDGRLKPDLVAPGERIRSCLLDNGWGELDGTSMAAPHVSGAAAMLMGRYAELIGEPRRIKKILCESATELGRERSFQGHGMLDVLRAFQSV